MPLNTTLHLSFTPVQQSETGNIELKEQASAPKQKDGSSILQPGICKDEFESQAKRLMAVRLMETFRLNMAEELPGIVDVLDIGRYIHDQIESIIQDNIGLEPESSAYENFRAYIDDIEGYPESKEYQIYMNTWNGIQHYQKNEDENEALQIMKIGFEEHRTNEGELRPVDSQTFILIMSKIYDQLLFKSYQKIQ